MKAAASGSADTPRDVLQHGPDDFEHHLNRKDQFGNNAFAYFLSHRPGNIDPGPITRMLISAGVDVNARDITGQTPLFAACEYQPGAVRILARAGTDVNARDRMGETALVHCKNPAGLAALRVMGAGRK